MILPRFTKKAWMELGKFEDERSGELLFEQTQIPGNLVDFLGPKAEQLPEEQVIKIVTLNDRFTSWVKQKYGDKKVPLKELSSAAKEYANDISDTQATEDLLKSKMNISRYLVALPVIFSHFPKCIGVMRTDYRINDQETLSELELEVSKQYGSDADTFIPGIVLKADELAKINTDEQDWISQIIDLKEHGGIDRVESTQLYESPMEYFTVCYIPAILTFKHNSAVMKIADIFDEIVNPILETAGSGTSKKITLILSDSFNTKSKVIAGYPIMAGDVESHAFNILTTFYSNLAEEIRDTKNPKPYNEKLLS